MSEGSPDDGADGADRADTTDETDDGRRGRLGPALARGRAGVARSRRAAATTADRGRSWVQTSDARLLLAFAVGLYGLFTVISVVLGYELNGIVDTLRRITFLSAVYAILVLALNIQWGYAGLFNIGVAGFMAVGVYTMAMVSTASSATFPGLGLPLPVGIVAGTLAAALLGVVVAIPALRLRGDYLAIVTLAAAEIVRLTYESPVFETFSVGGVDLATGATRGMSLPDHPIRWLFYENPTEVGSDPSALGSALFQAAEAAGIRDSIVLGWAWALALVVVVAAVYWLLRRVGNSPFGRVLKAIREDEVVARALGKDTRWFKIKAFALGCGLMGFGAILWRLGSGTGSGYVSPTMFQPIYTFYVFVALIIGGAGSNTGSVVGGAVFASILFEGPNFVRRIVTEYVDVGRAPGTLFDALGVLAGGVVDLLWYVVDVTRLVDVVAGLVQLDVSPLVEYLVGAMTALQAGPLLAYTLSDVNVSALRLVLLGVVLIYLIQNRPEGLLGHRKEVASPIDLADRGEREGEA